MTEHDDPQQALDRAFNLLKRSPHFPSAQVEIMDRIDATNAGTENEVSVLGPERLEHALSLLDARAEPYLTLISDIESQEAYFVILQQFAQITWDEYMGMAGFLPLPGNTARRQLDIRVRHWMREAYKRLVSADVRGDAEPKRHPNVSNAESRQTLPQLIKSLRMEARLTVEQLADKLNISVRSAYRHESGQCHIRAQNLKGYEDLFSRELKRKIEFLKA